jgi:hypothetical protein
MMRYSKATTQSSGLGVISAFALAVLAFSVLRGLVPLLTHNGGLALPTYQTVTLFGVALSCYGLFVALSKNGQTIGKWPRNLLVANLGLHLFYVIPVILLKPGSEFIPGIVYTGLLPFSIYGLIKIPEKILVPVLGVLTMVISGYVIYEFVAINTNFIADGYNRAFERQVLLRPDFEFYSRSGMFIRPSGLFGSDLPHDTGNILAIFFIFWFSSLFRSKGHRLPVALLAVMAFVALSLTQSASNNLAAIVGVLFVCTSNLKVIVSPKGILAIFVLMLISIAIIFQLNDYGIDWDVLFNWTGKVGGEGAWAEMTTLGGLHDPWTDLFAVLFGHGHSLDYTEMKIAEIGPIKLTLELGVLHAMFFYYVLLYPVVLFFSKQYRAHRYLAVPYVAAVLVGVVSTWHFGSIFRATNLFVFFALYAHALRIFAEVQGPHPDSGRR